MLTRLRSVHGRLGATAFLALGLAGPELAEPRATTATLGHVPDPFRSRSAVGADWRAELEAAKRELVAGLERVAGWCEERKLFATRDEIYLVLLQFDPQHPGAHKGLKHALDRDGVWYVPDDDSIASEDFKPSEVPAAKKRYEEVAATYRDDCVALVEAQGDELTALESDEILTTVLWALPDDPATHALRGEVLVGDAWLLEETPAALARRGELRELALAALDSSGDHVESADVADAEASIGVNWSGAAETPDVRVVGSVGPDEILRIAQVNHAIGEFFRGAFDTSIRHWDDLTVFVLGADSERDQFLDNYEAVPAAQRELYRTFVGTGFPESANVAVWQANPLERLDFATRHSLGGFLSTEFGITSAHGWAFEGFGLYLNRRIVRTRLTWYGSDPGGPAAQSLRLRLASPSGNWMAAAHELLVDGYELADLFRESLGEMDAGDMAVAYALAAYFIEGRAEVVADVLERVGAGENAATVIEDLTGLEPAALRARVVRWLEERQ